VVVAAGGIDAALEAGELLATVVEAQAQEALRVRFPDLRFLDGVETGDGLALDGAWAGGFLCVETIRFDLLNGGHKRKGTGGPGERVGLSGL
jgi:hypothetical protein